MFGKIIVISFIFEQIIILAMKKFILLSVLSFCLTLTSVKAQDAAEALYKTGEKFVLSGEFDKAIPYFDQALQANPKHKASLSRRGFCKVQGGDYNGAIADYTLLIETEPKEKFAYLSRGSAKNKLEQYDSAIEDFNKVLAIDPKDTEALNNRGVAKKKKGDKAGACADWTASKKLGNGDAKLMLDNNKCK